METSDTEYTDVMVDLETTGRWFDRTAIIQIGAVRFNLETGAVDAGDMFNRCLHLPPHRFWEESTRHWWVTTAPDVLQWIMERQEDPKVVIDDFFKWSVKHPGLRFWAKPTHFDFSFVSSYLADYGYTNPYHYRIAKDENSWLDGRYFPMPVPELVQEDFGAAHNALHDSLQQLDLVLQHYKATMHGPETDL